MKLISSHYYLDEFIKYDYEMIIDHLYEVIAISCNSYLHDNLDQWTPNELTSCILGNCDVIRNIIKRKEDRDRFLNEGI